METSERLQFVKWLISREDQLRGSTAQRGAIVLSANALLFAGITLLVTQSLQNGKPSLLALLLLSFAVLTLLVSTVCALMTSTTLWTSSDMISKLPYNLRLFINARATVSHYKDKSFSAYKEDFSKASQDDLLSNAMAEVWAEQHLYRMRYTMLRCSMCLFLATILLLIGAVITTLIP